MSDDDSPIFKRGGRLRGKHPVIVESQTSPSQNAPKLHVPPSPGPSTSQDPGNSRWEQARELERKSKRQLLLNDSLINHNAEEGNEGSSVDGSAISEGNEGSSVDGSAISEGNEGSSVEGSANSDGNEGSSVEESAYSEDDQ